MYFYIFISCGKRTSVSHLQCVQWVRGLALHTFSILHYENGNFVICTINNGISPPLPPSSHHFPLRLYNGLNSDLNYTVSLPRLFQHLFIPNARRKHYTLVLGEETFILSYP